ncbi:helix-turn-helix domain-containing protein [Streptomyces lushanensis]|uniref:helix-turn-helix domain-containing protein n=1 Tax=Streptomyces lushanensis TaxID=1434255 RepID=UPI000D1B99AE
MRSLPIIVRNSRESPTVAEACPGGDPARVSRPTVYDIVAAGHLDVVTVGTGKRPGIRIPEDSLAAYIAARRIRARNPLRPAA